MALSKLHPYVNLRVVGEGAFGIAWKCQHATKPDRLVVVKIFRPATDLDDRLKELHNCKLIAGLGKTKNLLEYVECIGDQRNPYALVFEFCNGGSLDAVLLDFIKNNRFLKPSEFLSWALQISDGVLHMHLALLCHCDLSPRNVLLCLPPDCKSDWRNSDLGQVNLRIGNSLVRNQAEMVPVGDYGTLTQVGQEQSIEKRGSPHAEPAPATPGAQLSGDIHSLGVMFKEMMFSERHSHADNSLPNTAQEVLERKSIDARLLQLETAQIYPTVLVNLVRSMIAEDAGARPSIDKVKSVLLGLQRTAQAPALPPLMPPLPDPLAQAPARVAGTDGARGGWTEQVARVLESAQDLPPDAQAMLLVMLQNSQVSGARATAAKSSPTAVTAVPAKGSVHGIAVLSMAGAPPVAQSSDALHGRVASVLAQQVAVAGQADAKRWMCNATAIMEECLQAVEVVLGGALNVAKQADALVRLGSVCKAASRMNARVSPADRKTFDKALASVTHRVQQLMARFDPLAVQLARNLNARTHLTTASTSGVRIASQVKPTLLLPSSGGEDASDEAQEQGVFVRRQMPDSESFARAVAASEALVKAVPDKSERRFLPVEGSDAAALQVFTRFCNLGTLKEFLATRVANEGVMLVLAEEAAHALAQLHRVGLVHRQLTLDSVLVHRPDGGGRAGRNPITFKLGDFGSARQPAQIALQREQSEDILSFCGLMDAVMQWGTEAVDSPTAASSSSAAVAGMLQQCLATAREDCTQQALTAAALAQRICTVRRWRAEQYATQLGNLLARDILPIVWDYTGIIF